MLELIGLALCISTLVGSCDSQEFGLNESRRVSSSKTKNVLAGAMITIKGTGMFTFL